MALETTIIAQRTLVADKMKAKYDIEAGQRTLVADKMKAKYEMITKAHNTSEDGEEENSQLYNLIWLIFNKKEIPEAVFWTHKNVS